VVNFTTSKIYWACSTSAKRRGAYKIWWGKLGQRHHLEDLGVNGRKYENKSSGSGERGMDRI
jgi:hypothetical protein